MEYLIFYLMLIALNTRCSETNKQVFRVYRQSCQWLELLEEKVSAEFRSVYHLMIFQLDSVKRPEYSNVFQFLSQRYPVLTYNIVKKNVHVNYLSGDVVFNIFIFHSNSSYMSLGNALFTWYTKNHRGFRPKSLLLYFHDSIYLMNFWFVLYKIWVNIRHLNVTVITVNLSYIYPIPDMHLLNPFTNISQARPVAMGWPIFPYKLANMHGVEMKAYAPEYIYLDNHGRPVSEFNRNKSFLPMFSILLMKHNITIRLMRDIDSKNLNKFLRKRLLDIELKGGVVEQQEFEILPTLYTYGDCPQIMGVVPIIQRSQLGNIQNVLINICTILVVIIIITYVRRFFFGPDEYWSIMNVSEMVIGGSTVEHPRTLAQKILFICFAFISMKYSSSFYSEVVDLKMVYDTIPFETFEEIINSKLPIYTYQSLKDLVLKEDTNPYTKELSKQIRLFDNNTYVRFCLQVLHQKKNRICLALRGEIDRTGTFNENTMTLTDPGFPCRQVSYHMGYGSVYFAPLYIGIMRLTEAGINQYVLRQHNNLVENFDTEVEEHKRKLLKLENNEKIEIPISNNIFAVGLTLGYLCSFVCFVAELFFKMWSFQVPFGIF